MDESRDIYYRYHVRVYFLVLHSPVILLNTVIEYLDNKSRAKIPELALLAG